MILDNWNKFKSFIYISLFFNTTSSVKLFVVIVQIFVYKCLFTIVFFGKRKKTVTKPFTFWKWKHISKWITFWKWKLLTNVCLQLCFSEKGKKQSWNLSHFEIESAFQKEPHFENESFLQMFVYNCVFWKKEKKTIMKPFTFWKWKHISKRTTFWKWKLNNIYVLK